LFPLGILAAVLGLVPWVLYAMSLTPWWPASAVMPWPGAEHAALMAQGFELAFVCGFLLTAMPAFTHGPRCSGRELAAVTIAVAVYIGLRAAGVPAAAWGWLTALALLAFIVGRRVRPGAAAPPEEFLLVATGRISGLVVLPALVILCREVMVSGPTQVMRAGQSRTPVVSLTSAIASSAPRTIWPTGPLSDGAGEP
jgi:uncharacterized protein involved in response to NO